MGVNISNSTQSAMLVYDKAVHSQIFNKNVLWNNLISNVARSTGSIENGKVLTLHYKRNVGSAAGSDVLTLPTAGAQGRIQANVEIKKNYQTISISDAVIQASQKGEEFLLDMLDGEYKGAREDMARQLSRQGYGYGNGVIAQVNGAVSSDTTVVVDNLVLGTSIADYIEVGNAIAFTTNNLYGSASDPTPGTTVFAIVDSIIDANTFKTTSAISTADDTYLVLAHSKGSTTPDTSNFGMEVMGLKGLIDDGSILGADNKFQGIKPEDYMFWNSYVNDNGTTLRDVTDALLQTTFTHVDKIGSPKFAITSPTVFNTYGNTLSADRRYTDTMTLKGGFTGVKFNNILLVTDYDCADNDLYMIDPTTISVEDLGPIAFINKDGKILDRDGTKFGATLTYYANLAISARNKNGLLTDVK